MSCLSLQLWQEAGGPAGRSLLRSAWGTPLLKGQHIGHRGCTTRVRVRRHCSAGARRSTNQVESLQSPSRPSNPGCSTRRRPGPGRLGQLHGGVRAVESASRGSSRRRAISAASGRGSGQHQQNPSAGQRAMSTAAATVTGCAAAAPQGLPRRRASSSVAQASCSEARPAPVGSISAAAHAIAARVGVRGCLSQSLGLVRARTAQPARPRLAAGWERSSTPGLERN